jgi:hypothetical protein
VTKFQLAASLFSTVAAPINITVDGLTGKVCQIQAENGGGSCFNVCLLCASGLSDKGIRRLVFVRTID